MYKKDDKRKQEVPNYYNIIIETTQINSKSVMGKTKMNSMLEKFLHNNKIDFKRKVDLSKFTYFKTGNTAEFVIYPNNAKELKIIFDFLKSNYVAYKVIGATTNLLFLDDVKYDVLISLRKFNSIEINEQKKFVKAEAGVMLTRFVRRLAGRGIRGFEGLEGIPGTVGGAIFMNAGAYGYEISGNLINIKVLTKEGDIKRFLKKDLKFAVRHSVFREKDIGIILDARFHVEHGNKDEINKKIRYFRDNRRTYQEHNYHNLGSIFATQDLYSEIAKHHLGYKLILYFVRKLNAILKPSDNKLLNKVTCCYFNLRLKKQPFSDKTMNCLINNSITSKEAVEYINMIRELIRDSVPLENEIVYKIDLRK